jgi:hypothetical protein
MNADAGVGANANPIAIAAKAALDSSPIRVLPTHFLKRVSPNCRSNMKFPRRFKRLFVLNESFSCINGLLRSADFMSSILGLTGRRLILTVAILLCLTAHIFNLILTIVIRDADSAQV